MTEKPNIVMLVMDTARAKNFSCYGYDRKTTPFMDQLAKKNVKYEHAVSQANWTLPSHASMFTGEYVSEHQAGNEMSFDGLDMVQEELQEKGYHTIGIPNVAYLSEEFGFDQYFDDFVSVDQGVELPKELEDKDWGRRLEKYVDLVKYYFQERDFSGLKNGISYVLKKHLLLNDSGAKKTNSIIKDKLSSLDDKPFFLFVNYIEPHTPYRPPFPYTHEFQENKFQWFNLIEVSNHGMRQYIKEDKSPEEELLETKEALYDGEINYLDTQIKKIHSFIKNKHPNTVFIILSDHGEYLYEHGLINHIVGLHEEVVHVPMIESFPNKDINENVSGNVELSQLRQHLLDLAEGKSETIEPTDVAISEDYGSSSSMIGGSSVVDKEKLKQYCVTGTKDLEKLFYYADLEKELYRLPEEYNKIEADNKELVEMIENRVGKPDQKDTENYQSSEIEDDKVKDKLKDLGYF